LLKVPDALLDEAAEGGEASAGPDHDDGRLVVRRQAECRLANKDRNSVCARTEKVRAEVGKREKKEGEKKEKKKKEGDRQRERERERKREKERERKK
jgi:hypothetical protein